VPKSKQIDIDAFRTKLRARQDELRCAIDEELIHEEREDYKDIIGEVRDTGDEAFADMIADLNIAGLNKLLEEFRDIDATINRIQQGTFGVCTDCADKIDVARLHAYPTAKRCIRCQQRRETSYADTTTPKPSL